MGQNITKKHVTVFDLNRANKKCILMRAYDFHFATQARIRFTASSRM